MSTTSLDELSATTIAEPQRKCMECGNLFDLPPFAYAATFVFVCPECSERHAVEADREAIVQSRARMIERWEKFCPKMFLDTVPHKLPSPTRLHKALEWQSDSGQGLLLHGSTGLGKSRVMWQVLKREFRNGKRIKIIDGQITYELCAAFNGKGQSERWIENFNAIPILAMDDVFKAKLSEGVEQAIFTIIDTRIQNKLPTIITSNDTGDSLAARMSPDRGAPLVRRLRESFLCISF